MAKMPRTTKRRKRVVMATAKLTLETHQEHLPPASHSNRGADKQGLGDQEQLTSQPGRKQPIWMLEPKRTKVQKWFANGTSVNHFRSLSSTYPRQDRDTCASWLLFLPNESARELFMMSTSAAAPATAPRAVPSVRSMAGQSLGDVPR